MANTQPGNTSAAEPAATWVLLRGFLFSGPFGAAVAAIVVGAVIGRMPLLGAGIGAVVLLVALMVGVEIRGRSKQATREVRTALARIESRRATSGEMADVPVEFMLTVAPEDRPAYRVRVSISVNLVDLPDYPVGGLLVVEYQPEAPWCVRIISSPTPEWAQRAAEGAVDSAPQSALVTDPVPAGSFCLVCLVALLIGAAIVILPLRAELFKDDGPAQPAPTSSATTTTTTTTSSSWTVTLPGSGESMLTNSQMHLIAETLLATAGNDSAAELTIDPHGMTIRGGTPDPKLTNPLLDLGSLPYDRLPGLLHEARTKLGIDHPESWSITFSHAARTKALVIRVTVTDSHGTASLEADAHGHITRRHPR
ncbi:hypothetical protein ACIQGZ_02540 [Streptomyces sp. NPDC092296]|uniref:hypothetical protein n=1 Tax=Streptomyces sp. NPDC092296 TaxID=3366012 RepID=UPI003815533E